MSIKSDVLSVIAKKWLKVDEVTSLVNQGPEKLRRDQVASALTRLLEQGLIESQEVGHPLDGKGLSRPRKYRRK